MGISIACFFINIGRPEESSFLTQEEKEVISREVESRSRVEDFLQQYPQLRLGILLRLDLLNHLLCGHFRTIFRHRFPPNIHRPASPRPGSPNIRRFGCCLPHLSLVVGSVQAPRRVRYWRVPHHYDWIHHPSPKPHLQA
jgi:hypothetical protein